METKIRRKKMEQKYEKIKTKIRRKKLKQKIPIINNCGDVAGGRKVDFCTEIGFSCVEWLNCGKWMLLRGESE